MFGPKIRNVFKSRWQALFWSLSVLLTAYCTVPAPDDGKASPQDEQAVEQIVRGFVPHGADQHHHGNPWAKDKKPS